MKKLSSLFALLDDHQVTGVNFILKRRAAALLFEQGTGKTWVVGGVIEKLEPKNLSALLVVRLANLETTWLAMFEEHLPWVNVTRDFEEFKTLMEPRVLLIHYEALQNRKFVGKLVRRQWYLTCFDESQHIKDRNTHASRAAKRIGRKSVYKIALTGTPIEKSPIDMWAQMRFVAPQCLSSRWGDFDEEYLTPTGYMGYKRKFKKEKTEQYLSAIGPYCLRVEAKEVLDLPPLNVTPYPATMWSNQRKLYDRLERDAIAKLPKGRRVTAGLKIVLKGKLHQICGGYVFDDERDPHYVGGAKVRAVQSLIRKGMVKPPIVIFCRFRPEIDLLYRILSEQFDRVEVYHGKVKKKNRPQILRDFQSGKIDVLIAQVRTGGVGVDLFASCYGIIYSTTYSFIDYDQAIKRLYRRGQEREVNFFFLLVKDTIDEEIYQALDSKSSVAQAILDRLKRKKRQWQEPRQRRKLPRRRLLPSPKQSPPPKRKLPSRKKQLPSSTVWRTWPPDAASSPPQSEFDSAMPVLKRPASHMAGTVRPPMTPPTRRLN